MKLASSLLIALGFHVLVGAVPVSPVSSERGVEAAGYTGAGGALILNYDIVEEATKRDAEAEAEAHTEEAGYTGAGGALILNYDIVEEKAKA